MATAPDTKIVVDKEPLTEEEMIAILQKKFRVEPLTSTPSRRRTLAEALAGTSTSQDHSYTHHVSAAAVPKMPSFSGDEPPQKGDVTYQEWRFEVSCLVSDDEVSSSQLVQAMRRSLRGTARKMLIPLGEKATVDDILHKLDVMFGDVSSKGMVMQEFFNSSQRPSESVTAFGCRLESILQTAIDNGHINWTSKNDLLRHKFWTGLSSDKLKSQTRHKYDSLTNFDLLLREIRQVEKELSITPSSGKSAQHHPVTLVQHDTLEEKLQSLEKKLDTKFQSQFQALESRLNHSLDDKLGKIMTKLDTLSMSASKTKSNTTQPFGHQKNKPRWNRRWRNNKRNRTSNQGDLCVNIQKPSSN